MFWLHNQGLRQETIDAVNALNHMKNLEWVPVTPELCLNASILVKHYQLSPFDAYHAATALSRDSLILSTDHAYDRVTVISRVNPLEWAGHGAAKQHPRHRLER